MKGLYTVLLLVCSNIFMTFAWYGHLKLQEMKVIQEVITLIIFAIFTMIFFQGETLKWNHLAAGVCLVMAVYFVFMK